MNIKVKLIFSTVLEQVLSLAVTGVVLFWSAGRVDWWAAWAVLAVWLAWFVAIDVILFRGSRGLAEERSKPPAGAMKWDKGLLSLMRLVQLARYLLAGLDQRYGWTGGFALPLQVAALVTCGAGQALVAWAMAANPFFSQVVRIQKDRGHAVIRSGPYRVVRHPAYTGLILFELSVSTLLASWAALIAGGVCALLLVLRTVLEDRTLLAGLEGYADYARVVRQRLLPGIW